LAFKIFQLITANYSVSFAIFYLIFTINAQLLCRSQIPESEWKQRYTFFYRRNVLYKNNMYIAKKIFICCLWI